MAQNEKKEPKADRKTPERNPVRQLYLEKARLEFGQVEFDRRIAELTDKKQKAGLRLIEINQKLQPPTV